MSDPLRDRLAAFVTAYDKWADDDRAGYDGLLNLAGGLRDDLTDLLRAVPAAAPREEQSALLALCHEFITQVDVQTTWWEHQRQALCDRLAAARPPTPPEG